jgi:hypothetical protein
MFDYIAISARGDGARSNTSITCTSIEDPSSSGGRYVPPRIRYSITIRELRLSHRYRTRGSRADQIVKESF